MFRAKEYVRPKSLQEAYALNQKRSSVVVGGMMWLKMSSVYKVTVIDLSGLDLNKIEENEETFQIGCMCTLRQLETHPGLNGYFGDIFRECTRGIVGTQFRNGATVGGSVFGKFGFSDILTCLLMLDTQVELYGAGILPLAEFLERKPERDILVRVIIQKDGRRGAYVSQRRSRTDFPVIACGVARKDDTFYVSVGARPQRARLETVKAEAGESFEQLAKRAVAEMGFYDNMRASGEYRKALAEVYVRRLMETLDREDA